MSDNVAHALSGAGGGIISMALTYPLITISSRMQVQKNNKSLDSYHNSFDALKKIIQREGFSGLYSGLDSALFGIAVTNGVYYYFYEWTKSSFMKAKRIMSTGESMLCGAIAGAATAIITNPIWVVNTRMTTKRESLEEGEPSTSKRPLETRRIGTIEATLKIIREDGILAFWQGVVPALILVINPVIQYTVFEQLKGRLQRNRKLTNFDFFWLGAVSKLVATGVTYPYIVIKSRMQLRQSEKTRYKSVFDGLRKIIQTEGVEGLYKGLSAKLSQSVLTAAFLFMYKEALFKYSIALLVLLGARKTEIKVVSK
ncbi:uncharacterized protein VTP21DRAFT_8626 [Calcarisporiella thermophila]|uniref:uncharacterized protein n=1 Tax=Calcarisporiella thermophila TaxID=911321 RepID=UPI0037423429